MKKCLIVTFLMLLSTLVFGQDILDFRMCDVFNGKVKSISVTSPEQMQSEIEFTVDGKIKHMKNPMFNVDYDWIGDDELKIIMSNGQESESFYIYINEYREDYYEYEMGESTMRIWFRHNGSINKKELTQNGNVMEMNYDYHSDSDLYPYKTETRMGAQSQTIYMKVDKYDSRGNAIVCSQSSNGITIQLERTIKYY